MFTVCGPRLGRGDSIRVRESAWLNRIFGTGLVLGGKRGGPAVSMPAIGRRTREQLLVAVAEVVRLIPPGRVLTYGDIAEIVGTGPRQVGWAMAQGTVECPWWRVVTASGSFPLAHREAAQARHSAEGTPLSRDCERVNLEAARIRPEEWLGLVRHT